MSPGKRRKHNMIDPTAKQLANDISVYGFRGDVHKGRIADMNTKQREGTLRALFDRMFSRKKQQNDTEGFKTKHGRGVELNDELYTEDDVNG